MADATQCELKVFNKARQGSIKNFTGIDSAYESPESREITPNKAECAVEPCAEKMMLTSERGTLFTTE